MIIQMLFYIILYYFIFIFIFIFILFYFLFYFIFYFILFYFILFFFYYPIIVIFYISINNINRITYIFILLFIKSTSNVDGLGTLRLLDAIRTCRLDKKIKFYQVEI